MAKKVKYFKVEPLDSMRDMLQKAVAEMGDAPLFRYKKGGEAVDVSAKEFSDLTVYLGNALAQRGFVKDCHIACVGANSYNWLVVFLSVLCGQNVFVPIDKELPESDFLNILDHSDSVVLFCDRKFLPLIEAHKAGLPKLRLVVCLDAEAGVSLSALLKEGEALAEGGYGEYLAATSPDLGLKMLVYTSGTTGAPKGVMLSQHNLRSAIYYGLMVEGVKDRCLSVLPYHHTYESVIGILVSIHHHSCICLNESLRALLNNLKFYKPSYLFVVPLFAELFYKRIQAALEEKGKAKTVRRLIRISNGLRKVGIDLRRVFFKQIADQFGGRLVQLVCGGAPVRAEVGEFFTDIGINMLNGYGITECSPLVAVNQIADNDFASVGPIVPCLELKIDAPDENGDGEICVRGDTVMMGYYKAPALTAEVLRDGWFYTGDLGHYTDEKLYITGRKKNLIVLDNGKNVFPEEIEGYIYDIPYVTDAVVYSYIDGRTGKRALCAEGYLNEKLLPKTGTPEEVFRADVAAALKELPHYKHVSKVVVRREEFPKTSSKKIKRQELKKA